MKTLVLGMGNPILSDAGVGLVVAKALESRIKEVDVAVSPG
jgi:Ni,Fe-hydrogenase maturation factor